MTKGVPTQRIDAGANEENEAGAAEPAAHEQPARSPRAAVAATADPAAVAAAQTPAEPAAAHAEAATEEEAAAAPAEEAATAKVAKRRPPVRKARVNYLLLINNIRGDSGSQAADGGASEAEAAATQPAQPEAVKKYMCSHVTSDKASLDVGGVLRRKTRKQAKTRLAA